MPGVLEMAASITTPVGLGAFAIGAMLLAFREVVRQNLFPRLNQSLSVEIVRHLIDRLFWIAIVALVVGGLALVAPMLLGQRPEVNLIESRLRAQIPYGQPAYDFQENGIKVKYYDNQNNQARYVLVLPDGGLVRNVAFEGHRYEFKDRGVNYSFRINSITIGALDVTLVKAAPPQ